MEVVNTVDRSRRGGSESTRRTGVDAAEVLDAAEVVEGINAAEVVEAVDAADRSRRCGGDAGEAASPRVSKTESTMGRQRGGGRQPPSVENGVDDVEATRARPPAPECRRRSRRCGGDAGEAASARPLEASCVGVVVDQLPRELPVCRVRVVKTDAIVDVEC